MVIVSPTNMFLFVFTILCLLSTELILAMDNDPYDSILNTLGLSQESKTSSTKQPNPNAKQSAEHKLKRKFPKNYYGKDAYIDRRTKTLMRINKKLDPEAAQKGATRSYEIYLHHQRSKVSQNRMKYRQAKAFVQDADPELAKTMHMNPSNSKKDWIARRIRKLQKYDINLTQSEAQKQAHEQFLDKRVKDNEQSKKRYWRKKNNQASPNAKPPQY